MQDFNLITHPWIPVRWKSSTPSLPPLVSLHDVFTRGNEIADLDCLPHERIALIRLLVCITHATLGAPATPTDWNGFGDNISTEVPAYLKRADIHPHFNLLGDGPRFLQENVPSSSALVPSSKFIASLATGNNPTLLDHHGMTSTRAYPAKTIALALLTFQNFYPLYGAGYKGKGPCCESNALHTILLGENLTETILFNCIDLQTLSFTGCTSIGKPIWQCESDEDLLASTTTLLGRLVPRHRSLKMTDDLEGFYHRSKSLQYPGYEPYREASVTTFVDQKNNRRILSARVTRAIWRDLHTLTLLDQSHEGTSPIITSHIDHLDSELCTLWSGALITDLKAKILDTVESSFTVPMNIFTAESYRTYLAGVEHAEVISKKLYGAVKFYGSKLSHESPPTEAAQQHYWHTLDQHNRTLIHLAVTPEDLQGKPAIGGIGADDEWTKIVRQAALDAYQSVCPQTTPRQIQAYAAGLKPLFYALYPKEKNLTKQTKNLTTTQQTKIPLNS